MEMECITGVEGAHLRIGHSRALDEDDAVGSNAGVGCAETDAEGLRTGDAAVKVFDENIVVAAGVHLGEADLLPPGPHGIDVHQLHVAEGVTAGQDLRQGSGDPPLHLLAGFAAGRRGVEPAVEEAVQQLWVELFHLLPGETLHVPHVLLPQGREEGDGHVPPRKCQLRRLPGSPEIAGAAADKGHVPELLPAEQGFLPPLRRQGIVELAVEDLAEVALRLAVTDEVELHGVSFPAAEPPKRWERESKKPGNREKKAGKTGKTGRPP